MSYPAIWLATATVGRHRCPQKRMQTARQPPVYPNSSPDHRACNSLTPFRYPHAVHPCPSVDSGLDNLQWARPKEARSEFRGLDRLVFLLAFTLLSATLVLAISLTAALVLAIALPAAFVLAIALPTALVLAVARAIAVLI